MEQLWRTRSRSDLAGFVRSDRVDCTYRPRIWHRFSHDACGTSSPSQSGPLATSYTHLYTIVRDGGASATHYYVAARQPYLLALRCSTADGAPRFDHAACGRSTRLGSAFGSRPCPRVLPDRRRDPRRGLSEGDTHTEAEPLSATLTAHGRILPYPIPVRTSPPFNPRASRVLNLRTLSVLTSRGQLCARARTCRHVPGPSRIARAPVT